MQKVDVCRKMITAAQFSIYHDSHSLETMSRLRESCLKDPASIAMSIIQLRKSSSKMASKILRTYENIV